MRKEFIFKMQFKIILSIIISFILASCNRDNKDTSKNDITDFMVMNLVNTDVISFPSSYNISDENGNIQSLDSILKKPQLVFRFSEQNCDICIQSEIELINQLNFHGNVIGMSSYSTIRKLKLAKKKYKINFPIYNIPLNESNSIFPAFHEECDRPYWFFLDAKLNGKNIFIPSSQFPEVSKKYIEETLHWLNALKSHLDIFNETTVKLDVIKIHQTQKVIFKYVNQFQDALIIQDVKASCGCTIPSWDKKPLQRNESSELVILFTPKESGYNSKTIMVSHSQSKHPVKLTITANVK